MFVVTVLFTIHEQNHQDFIVQITDNANTSLAAEVGCIQFDVCTSREKPFEVFLYEVYATEAAFELHLASEHFKIFSQRTASWVADKQVMTYVKTTVDKSLSVS